MLVESPIGNLFDAGSTDISASQVDWVDLTWAECSQRALHKHSRQRRDVRILLKLGATLAHGDVLWREGEHSVTVVVNILPARVLVASPRDLEEAVAVAFELGNLHVPIQFTDQQIIAPEDGPTDVALKRLEVPYELQTRRFEPSLRGNMQVAMAEGFSLVRRT